MLTGAGVSAASGVPTFRGAGGLWASFRAEDLATPGAFARDPHTVWAWYDWRRSLIAQCLPNAAHHVLASWSLRFAQFTLITQNVDGLHERAGTRGVVHLHGSIWDVGCWRRCGMRPTRWRDETVPFPSLPPMCPDCGGHLRPGVVWFGEPLDERDIAAATEAARCDVFFTIGTAAVVHPAAGLIDLARSHGAASIEINPEPTAASAAADLVVTAGAESALPAIDAQLGPHPLTLTTTRLVLHPLLPADLSSAHTFWCEEDVRRYLWDDVVITERTAEAVLHASAADFAAHGYGLWGVHAARPAGTEMLGFCGLRSEGVGDAPELLFGLTRPAWGRGLAVEASLAVLGRARRQGVPAVIAATDTPNQRSQRTLARLGFVLERQGLHHGLDTLFYRLRLQTT